MELRSWFEWVQEFPTSVLIRESIYGYPALLTGHAVSIVPVCGRLIGLMP